MKFFYLGILILINLILLTYILFISNEKHSDESFDQKHIYCIMVTGKSHCRYNLAKKSVQNFKEQTYPLKKLIILNHGDQKIISEKQENIFEFVIDKSNMTLGDIRNIGLNLVEPESYWTTWDDDDYRDPEYLSYLYKNSENGKYDIVAFSNRYEYNFNNGFFWKTMWLRGFPACLVKLDKRFQFLSKDTMEDVKLFETYAKLQKKIKVIKDNDPKIYMRIVHTDNTSTWINYKKNENNMIKSDTLNEFAVDEKTKNHYISFLSSYYKEGLLCMKNF